jgi:hypothetical protein
MDEEGCMPARRGGTRRRWHRSSVW